MNDRRKSLYFAERIAYYWRRQMKTNNKQIDSETVATAPLPAAIIIRSALCVCIWNESGQKDEKRRTKQQKQKNCNRTTTTITTNGAQNKSTILAKYFDWITKEGHVKGKKIISHRIQEAAQNNENIGEFCKVLFCCCCCCAMWHFVLVPFFVVVPKSE